ncbi:hypothetical protein GLOTRDRAFT_139692 [Gloeophyllum trabeum ATCC 11539]|uniref:F-box domain-containing protein n=1 Tax=Gloeophyllum trabeum (strain ATCC 11539 / FP-39264 / Madison 617) TaxID=670483 RepID=S7RGW9_GLOTA|nr:uncharacterized protein GLOTRDRAFT_139692 [Gloeophyllum trabeum ATCC 11539]EPQ53455.1 hypothetical protein GLOTRDRAFT_139692 [Gloeophyllum trabeum ATCC 11539]
MHSPWVSLPAEMKLAVIDLLEVDQAKNFAFVSRETRRLCATAIFQSVILKSHEDLVDFLRDVPAAYYPFIRRLDVCSKSTQDRSGVPSRTEAVTALLRHCTQLERLSLRLEGSLANNAISCFCSLHSLKNVSIQNCGDEASTPISERFVVSIAASVPRLEELSLYRISRSTMHAPELVGVYPYVPVVAGDEDIEDHPLLGSALYLPSLLRIPTLRKLVIRDTHLGDPRWATAPVACPLEILDLGSSYHETDEFNRVCTERIIRNVGATIDEFTLNTSFGSSEVDTTVTHVRPQAEQPLKKLRKLHLTPLVPVDNVVDTLSTLGGSPIERISVQCFEYDVADVCTALQDFLALRGERAETGFYAHLNEIQVTVTEDLDALSSVIGGCAIPCGSADAAARLQAYCRELLGEGIIDDASMDCKLSVDGDALGKCELVG